jgi:hypothetical protein
MDYSEEEEVRIIEEEIRQRDFGEVGDPDTSDYVGRREYGNVR